MDGLSVAASVIAVLQLTGEVIEYLKDVKDALEDCQQCYSEASNLHSLLINLLYYLNQRQTSDTWYTAVRALNVQNGPLDQYRQALVLLLSKVEVRNGLQKIKRQLLWKFNKEEAASILARMERLKSLVSIALEMDHIKLSLAIKDDTTSIQASLLPLQASAVAIEAGIDTLYAETRLVKDDTVSIRDALPPLQASTTAIEDAQKLQYHQAIMEWLSPTDFAAQQHDIISRRQKGTSQWFLDSDEFKQWLKGSNKTLLCPGMPGAGKTMNAAVAIDHLHQIPNTGGVGLAIIFCNYKADQSGSSLFGALLRQLVQGRLNIATPVKHMYQKHTSKNSKPSLDEILETLQSLCSTYTTVFIVVDALDECTVKDGTQSRLIDELCELQMRMDVRLLFTSRDIPQITLKFQSSPTLAIRASAEDVRLFVAGQIPRLPRCIQQDEELKRAIQTKIVNAVDGMFLLARLHVDSLLDKRNKQKVFSTLDRFSKGSAALEHAYGEAIRRIDGQLDEDRLLARRAICWISHAQRPLTTKELCCALAIEPGDKALNTDNVYEIEDIISVCAGLVTVDEESSIIRLTHYTTQEYFEGIRLGWNPGAQDEIAVACLTYVSFDTFQSGSCASDKIFEQRLAENPLFDYSAHFWSEHIRPVQRSSATSELAIAFLRDEALVDSVIQTASVSGYKSKDYSKYFPSQTSGLHLVARYGLLSLTERLSKGGYRVSEIEVDTKDSIGETPLSRAAMNGHKAIVKLLLDTGKVEADSKDNEGYTPLSWAAQYGHVAVVKLLLDTGKVEADSKDNKGYTPLSWAAQNGHVAVVKLLLDTGKVEADSKHNYGETPLLRAVVNGHETVVKLLLDTGKVEADWKNSYDETPLSLAVQYGHVAVVKLLLNTGKVNADSRDESGQTPLSTAAANGHEAIVKLLLDTGKVEADSKNNNGRTPLSLATAKKHEAIVNLLLDTGKVEADWKNSYDETPLSLAVQYGHVAVVKLLLNTGKVNADSRNKYGQTPLSTAAANGHEAIVKLLLDTGKVEADSRDKYGQTPLSTAVANGHEAIVKLLLDTGKVEGDSRNKYGQTPLSTAAANGHEAVVKLLLDTGKVEADSKDNKGYTPLSWAAQHGHVAVVKLLLDAGKVEADSKDKYGQTPLSTAAANGHEAIVKLLLDTDKVEADSKDNRGYTSLSWAAQYGHVAVVKLLLDTGKVEADSKDNKGYTPLSWAAQYGHVAVVKLLLDTGKMEADSKDNRGYTPLSWAAQYGHVAVVKLLLDTGKVEADSKDNNGRTPLSLATVGKYEAIVNLL